MVQPLAELLGLVAGVREFVAEVVAFFTELLYHGSFSSRVARSVRTPVRSLGVGGKRGRPTTYPIAVTASIIFTIVRPLHTVHELLMCLLNRHVYAHIAQLIDDRRSLSDAADLGTPFAGSAGDVACADRLPWTFGELLQPWASCGERAIDSTVLSSNGGVWHKKNREAGIVPIALSHRSPLYQVAAWVGLWLEMHLSSRRCHLDPAGAASGRILIRNRATGRS